MIPLLPPSEQRLALTVLEDCILLLIGECVSAHVLCIVIRPPPSLPFPSQETRPALAWKSSTLSFPSFPLLIRSSHSKSFATFRRLRAAVIRRTFLSIA